MKRTLWALFSYVRCTSYVRTEKREILPQTNANKITITHLNYEICCRKMLSTDWPTNDTHFDGGFLLMERGAHIDQLMNVSFFNSRNQSFPSQ